MRRWLWRTSLCKSTETRLAHTLTRSFGQARRIGDVLETEAHLDGKDITVNGFVKFIRRQKRVVFAAISDGSSSTPLQVILKPEQADTLSVGSAVRVAGKWTTSAGKGQAFELHADEVAVQGDNDVQVLSNDNQLPHGDRSNTKTHQNNPIQNKYQTPEFLRTIPHLRSRTTTNATLLRLRSQVIHSITNFFTEQGFVQTQPPIITSSDCEGAGEVFNVAVDRADKTPARQSEEPEANQDYFQSTKYLTVSSQLHLEALAQAVSKVWTLSPTFRAEKSDTARHLSEFYMLEAEVAFIEDLEDVMNVVESMLRGTAQDLSNSRLGMELLQLENVESDEVDAASGTALSLENRWRGLLGSKWPRITYAHAMNILRHAVDHAGVVFEMPPDPSKGIQTEHERYLAAHVGRGAPVFVTHYPAEQKPFYMKASTAQQTMSPTVDCFDLLVPELCEIVGGSMREHRLEPLQDAMAKRGMRPEPLDWYLDLRRYGSVPHGGFGMGFDRFLCYVGGVANIRDMVAYPRWYGRCTC